MWFENSKTRFPCHPASRTVGGVPKPHLAYVDFAVTNPVTFLGILKYSRLLAKAKEFGGINIDDSPFTVIKLSSVKFFGSAVAPFILVKILNSSPHLKSNPKLFNPWLIP